MYLANFFNSFTVLIHYLNSSCYFSSKSVVCYICLFHRVFLWEALWGKGFNFIELSKIRY